MGKKHAPRTKEQCNLKAGIIHQFPERDIYFDVFSAVINFDKLAKLLDDEINLYAQQNGREFHTNEKEMRPFLGINYTMSINKLPTIESYWGCGHFIVVHFSENTKDDKSDNDYKVRSLINHFNQNFSNSVSNYDSQRNEKYMVKFKG